MNSVKALLFIWILLSWGNGFGNLVFAETIPARVLLISSYHPGFPTFFQQIRGAESVLAQNGVMLDVEFMDKKRFADDETEALFLKMLSSKLSKTKPYDAVMTADDDALQFLLKYKASLFPAQPAVFFGVNNIDKAKEQNDRKDISGVIEAVSMLETVRMMIDLLPDTRTITALVDTTPSSLGDAQKFMSLASSFPELTFSELSLKDHSYAEFAADLRQLDNTTAVLLLSAYVDREGQRMSFEDSLSLILDNVHQPVFHLWYHGIGRGLLGGKVISHEQQGRTAAAMVLRILAGEPIEKMKVIEESPNVYAVDYDILKKHGLENSKLPEEAIVMNRPASLYEKFKYQILLLCTFFVVQSVFVLFLVNSIRKNKKTESALRQSERRLAHLIECLGEGVILQDASAEILLFNKTAEQIFGLRAHEVVGGPATLREWNTVHEDGSVFPASEHPSLHTLQTGEPCTDVIMGIQESEQAVKWIKINTRPFEFSEENRPSSVIISFSDITDRKLAEEQTKRLQEQLVQAQKMEAIGTLAGGIAHDFNNILGAILGYAEMAKEALETDSAPYQDLQQVILAGERARDMVKKILAFSRRQKSELTAVRPEAILAEVAGLLKSSLPSTITIELDSQFNARTLYVDPGQIQQILMNLCTNAFHAMEGKGGCLSLSLTEHHVEIEENSRLLGLMPGRYARFSVEDTGQGIPDDVMPHIFEPYYTTKEVGKGTGMGLAIVHGLVKNYGGTVTVKSVVGQGTRCDVYIPVVDVEEVHEAFKEPQEPAGHERVLLIDDEQQLLNVNRKRLERRGYQVKTFPDGNDALAWFSTHPDDVDIVVTDQTMPNMTGLDLAAEMLQVRPGLPIILCTGYSSHITPEVLEQIGIKGFLMKPVSKGELALLIRDVLDRNKDQADGGGVIPDAVEPTR